MPIQPPSDAKTWIETVTTISTIIGAILAIYSAKSASRQAKAAEITLRETQKQSAITKAELQEMRRQSDIFLHSHRLEIYKVFLEFRFELKLHASKFHREKLGALWSEANLAELYFSPNIVQTLYTSLDKALELQILDAKVNDFQGKNTDDALTIRKERTRVLLELDKTLDTLDADMKIALRDSLHPKGMSTITDHLT